MQTAQTRYASKFSINQCTEHDQLLDEFHMPIGSIYGHDRQGHFVFTGLRLTNSTTLNPLYIVIYRCDVHKGWMRVRLNANKWLYAQIARFIESHPVKWQACHKPITKQDRHNQAIEREASRLDLHTRPITPMRYKGARLIKTKYTSDNHGHTMVFA